MIPFPRQSDAIAARALQAAQRALPARFNDRQDGAIRSLLRASFDVQGSFAWTRMVKRNTHMRLMQPLRRRE